MTGMGRGPEWGGKNAGKVDWVAVFPRAADLRDPGGRAAFAVVHTLAESRQTSGDGRGAFAFAARQHWDLRPVAAAARAPLLPARGFRRGGNTQPLAERHVHCGAG